MVNIYKKKEIIFSVLSLIFFLIFQSFSLAQSGSIEGTVKDKSTGEALPGANVIVKGTSLGAATDLDGKFLIRNLPVGKQNLEISYVGYNTINVDVTIAANKTLQEDFSLEAKTLEGQTVTVTAQARGQLSAINQQLSSSNLVNVVSAEKMQELPDANLAESIGRLPGISLQRNAGEAYAVTIRGLSPKYNEVTIEGVPMASTNYQNREVDLSLLSDNLIKAVEVSKTLRPDMDADALGGVVNLTLRTAQPGLHYDVRANGGYNNLRDTYKNYKFTGTVSNRFLSDKIGILAQGNIELKQLPSDQFNAAYDVPIYDPATDQFSVGTQNANLTDASTKRHRYGISLVMDYTSDLVDVKFYNVFDQKNDSNITRSNLSRFSSNDFYDQIFINETKTKQETHSIQAMFKLGNTELPVSLSYTKGEQNVPNGLEFDFLQTGVSTFSANQRIYQPPSVLIAEMGVINPTSQNTTFWQDAVNDTKLTDESYDVKLDWKAPFKLSDSFSGYLKVGGKYHSVRRTSNRAQQNLYMLYGAGAGTRKDLIATYPFLNGLNSNLQAGIPAYPFVDHGYTRTNILGYPIGPSWNVYQLADMQNTYYYGKVVGNDTIIAPHKNLGGYWVNGPNSFNQNYVDNESTTAGYIMGEFNVGSDLTIVPGARYQQEKTDISAYHIRVNGGNQTGLDGTPPKFVETKRNYPHWFPSVNVKYKATDNIQLLGALYRSVSLPSYGNVNPLVQLTDNAPLVAGNPILKPATAWNLDLGVSLFSNDIGLFTVDLFYKEITDLIYNMQNFYPYSPYPIIGAPADLADRLPDRSYFDTTWATSASRRLTKGPIPMNDPEKAYLRGIEFSWQTHLWYLPGVLSGIVLDLNLSLMSSNQLYPSFELKPKTGFLTPDTLVYQTTSGSLQDQPSAIYNAIIGWDYKGFSSRVSFRYQQKTLTSVDTRFGLQDTYYDNVLLVDVSLKQQIWEGLAVFANASNINNHIDNYYYSHPTYVSATTTYPAGNLPTSGQTYGWIAQFGVSYTY
ncbi:MAG: TonB-dependent receptor [Ignavibacteriaceae bacterium]